MALFGLAGFQTTRDKAKVANRGGGKTANKTAASKRVAAKTGGRKGGKSSGGGNS